MKQASSVWFLLPFAGALAAVVALQEVKPARPVSEGLTFAFNEGKPTLSPELAELLSFGYGRALSSLLWLRFLQYTPTEKVPRGTLSWIYYDLDTISRIDPDFLPVFEQGGIFLSVITEDKEGARRILERGVSLHPDLWRLRGNLAYHYEWELGMKREAGEQYLAAAKLPGAPYLFKLLAASHLGRTESKAASLAFLKGIASSSTDELVRRKVEEKIEKLEREGGNP